MVNLGTIFTPENNKYVRQIVHFISASRMQNLYVRENVYYSPDYADFSEFGYYLLWWIIMINFLVALFNMIPAGIFDGGRFFFLTVWGITKKEKTATKASKALAYFFLFILFLIVATWLFRWGMSVF